VKTLESWRPRRGLSIPCVTALDPEGRVIEEDQRRLVRFLIQRGHGAGIVFAMGTTGEWNRLAPPARQRVIQLVVEEVRKSEAAPGAGAGCGVEAWAGVTAPTRAETLELVEFALTVGADAVVLAPLAVRDVEDPVRFIRRDVQDLLDARGARIPLFLYDNDEIAVRPEQRLRTRQVKELSRLDFVRGIKVSAPPRRLGHYTKAASHFRDLGDFAIYVGNALYVLEMMKPRSGLWGALAERWNRFLLHDMMPAGVVAGPANLWPREWRFAWQLACAGDVERSEPLRRWFERFRGSYTFGAGRRPSLAALKRGLHRLGVLSSDAVAAGTAALTREEAERFDRSFDELCDARAQVVPAWWRSDPGAAEPR
jgi:dihydrodipicolinate synthase/N-acetylneuraminate lyase